MVTLPAPANIHDLEIVLFGLVLFVGLLSLELLECLFLQVGVALVSLVPSDSESLRETISTGWDSLLFLFGRLLSFTLFALFLFVSPTLTLRFLALGGLTGWGKVIITEEIWFERLIADSGFDINLVITLVAWTR